MKILLAGPGTGKTTRVKEIITTDYANAKRILVLSFTNATVRALISSFADHPNVECFTLHKYALKINHLKKRYILDGRREKDALREFALAIDVDFSFICEQLGCITFEAMITECLAFLKANPVYGTEQIGHLDLLIVDEYQDFNPTERALIDQIARFATETVILGDDDQSIYGFKDADPDGIIELFKDNSVAKLDHANMCWRCPDIVVDHARKLIERNVRRVAKAWNRTGKQGNYATKQTLSEPDAIEYVVSEIEKARAKDVESSFLVLSPTGFCVEGLVNTLLARKIPCVDFWSSPIGEEVYTRVWWLRAIFTSRSVLNLLLLWKTLTPHFRKKLKEILKAAFQTGFNEREVLGSIREMFDNALARHIDNPPTLNDFVEQHPSYAELVARLDQADLAASTGSLLADINPAKEFDRGCVNVMSIHKSKGLEAKVVFIVGLVDGVLPNDSYGIDTIEAQRRLLFVGITRALGALHLVSWVQWGDQVHKVDKSKFDYKYTKKCYYGKTSRFVGEME
jgi:DNA helicase-2/ATP-dependent DNA helicase PcrA